MKRYLTVTALVALYVSRATAQPPVPGNTHFISNGEFVSLSFQAGNIAGWVYVARCGSLQSPRTCLNYTVSLLPPPPPPPPPGVPPPPPPPPIPIEAGGGLINDSDFSGSFAKGYFSVHTDTSTLSEPFFHRDFGLGGPISLEFVRTGDMWQHSAGTSETRLASGLKYQSSGETTSSSASAKGNVLVWSLPGTPPTSFAIVGENQQVQIGIQH